MKFQIYRASLVIAVVSTAAMGMTDNLLLWALLRFVDGFASIAGLVLASGLILDWLNRHGHRPELGLHFSGIGFGIAVSAVAVAAMADLPWDWQWINLGLLGIVFFVPAWWWLPRPDDEHAAASGAAAVPSRRWLNLMAAAYFCAGFGYVISATFIVDILEALPLLAGRGGWIWLLVGAAAVGIVSLSLSIVGRHYPANPARAMARLTLSYGVAQIVAPAMAGYIASFAGNYRGSLGVAAAVMLAGMVLLIVIGRKASE